MKTIEQIKELMVGKSVITDLADLLRANDAESRVFEAFRDDVSIGTKTWPGETAPVSGAFGYVLGIHKGYSYSANFRPKAGFKIRNLKVSRT